MTEGDTRDAVVELAKRRGFFFPTAEAYGGTAGFWTFGPHGSTLKHHIETAWREHFAVVDGHQQIEAPTILPEAVFDASGHLEDFTDLLITCPACDSAHRADHLLEDTGEIEDAEGLSPAAIEELIADLEVTCPTCGEALAGEGVEEFNLMFKTSIGPGDGEVGYLRPETAQGIFVDFPRFAEYARNQLPFGVTQIGPAYRNEISPRRSIIRVREMAQAELEWFYDPDRHEPPLAEVKDISLRLYPIAEQEGASGPREITVNEASEANLFDNEWILYYLARAQTWFVDLGLDPDRLRFRQHLPGERSHYARDCWDAEAHLVGDWIELAGFADRGTYDLSKHHEHGDDSYTVFRSYDEPRRYETETVDPDMSVLGPEFGDRATAIAAALEARVEAEPEAFRGADSVQVTVEGETYEVPIEATGFGVEEVTEAGEHVMPSVVEPSFGLDRAVYAVLEHRYREDELEGEPRQYLALPPHVAPVLAGVFPLMRRDGMPSRAEEIRDSLAAAGLTVVYDETGNIGRRYRRQDEIGTPFCVTVDHQTLEDDTVTLRERDTTEQIRLPVADLEDTLTALRDQRTTFEALQESA